MLNITIYIVISLILSMVAWQLIMQDNLWTRFAGGVMLICLQYLGQLML